VQPFTWSAFGELPCAAQNNRALRNSLRSDSPRAIPVISPLLGCVKWHKKQVRVLDFGTCFLTLYIIDVAD